VDFRITFAKWGITNESSDSMGKGSKIEVMEIIVTPSILAS